MLRDPFGGGASGAGGAWDGTLTSDILADVDNTYDIGASGANRPRNIHLAGALTGVGLISTAGDIRAGAAGFIYWNARSQMTSPADGQLLLQDIAGTSFGRLQFGGTTSAFPALKRSGAGLEARLADDSALAAFTAQSLTGPTGTTFVIKSNGNMQLWSDAGGNVTTTGNFVASGNVGIGSNLFLVNDAANILALRNGANAQALRIYDTYTDASNYSRIGLSFAAGSGLISTAAAGTGVYGSLQLRGNILYLTGKTAGGGADWYINGSGYFLAGTDNTYDIGASGASRPRNLHLAGTATIAGAVTLVSGLNWAGFGGMARVADGVQQFYTNGFGANVCLRIATASVLDIRNTGNTDWGTLKAFLQTHADAVAETPTASHTLLVKDGAGTSYKVLCVPA